ncbi:SRPBCC domain-containing protein [Nocardiopsis changdeensis]|uniref:SRPBCC domain-containing protein n=1 Tax=Nocardiopsis changdeensis TaxID=2831969 RepID=A0ABX8BGK6_9ACTN|nr:MULTISPECIES: SRPBCC domain-containing protein [Nocardiopsis]QUX21162.1 SRPBCC domain-containing protein [Nocardiopsis changdeensis]QYX37092.1 SRPBCC domain-containing protein [Nocardiopsis sp. MT53]
MTETSPVLHGTFTVPFTLAAAPGRVFAGFSDEPLRRRWFRMPGPSATARHRLDFRTGGTEEAGSVFPGTEGPEELEYRSRFLDIAPDRRIVYGYEARVNGVTRWTSQVILEFASETGGTLLTWTEQYAFLVLTGDGSQDVAHLKGATRLRLNGLASVVEDRPAPGRPLTRPRR